MPHRTLCLPMGDIIALPQMRTLCVRARLKPLQAGDTFYVARYAQHPLVLYRPDSNHVAVALDRLGDSTAWAYDVWDGDKWIDDIYLKKTLRGWGYETYVGKVIAVISSTSEAICYSIAPVREAELS